jgi:hypothetical protein
MRCRLIMGVFALALPFGTLHGTQSATFARSTGSPITCTGLKGTMTFGTALSASGVMTTSKMGEANTIVGSSFACSSGPSTFAPITVNGGKNTKVS